MLGKKFDKLGTVIITNSAIKAKVIRRSVAPFIIREVIVKACPFLIGLANFVGGGGA